MSKLNEVCISIRDQLSRLAANGTNWKKKFAEYDLLGSGIISFSDFRNIIMELGLIIREDELKIILNGFCIDYKLIIDTRNFLSFLFLKNLDNNTKYLIENEYEKSVMISGQSITTENVLLNFSKTSDDFRNIDHLRESKASNYLCKNLANMPLSKTYNFDEIKCSWLNTIPETFRRPIDSKINETSYVYDHSKSIYTRITNFGEKRSNFGQYDTHPSSLADQEYYRHKNLEDALNYEPATINESKIRSSYTEGKTESKISLETKFDMIPCESKRADPVESKYNETKDDILSRSINSRDKVISTVDFARELLNKSNNKNTNEQSIAKSYNYYDEPISSKTRSISRQYLSKRK